MKEKKARAKKAEPIKLNPKLSNNLEKNVGKDASSKENDDKIAPPQIFGRETRLSLLRQKQQLQLIKDGGAPVVALLTTKANRKRKQNNEKESKRAKSTPPLAVVNQVDCKVVAQKLTLENIPKGSRKKSKIKKVFQLIFVFCILQLYLVTKIVIITRFKSKFN
jgi:hypothetical protein